MMKIEIVGIDTPPLLQFWSGAEVSPFVAFYDGNVSTAVIFLPEAVDRKDSIARNKVELVEKKSLNGAFYDGRVATAQANLPRNGLHLKHQPLRHVQLTGFKISSADIIIYNQEFLSMARTLVLDFKEFLEDQLTSLMNLDLLKRELSLSTAYNQTMLATLDPGEVESRVVIPPSNPRYLAEVKKDGLPFVAFYDGIVATAVIFLPGDVDYLKSPPNSARNKTEPGEREGPFVAFYDGVVATAQIFLPGAVDQTDALTSSPRNKVELVKKRNPYFAFYDESVARTQAILTRNVHRLKHQPLSHVQLVGLRIMDSPYVTHNEEFLSMARTLVLDYKEFLEDQLSSLMNLALLKRELSLSTAYNQTMLATLDPGEVESRVVIPPSNPRYLAEVKKDGLPFVAFYDGIVATAVIFLPGDVDYLKSPPNSARNKTEPGEREGPFVAFYDGIVATAVIFLPGHAKPLVPAPPTPRSSTQMETEPSQDIISNERKLTKPRVLLPFLQKEVPPEVVPPKPRPLVRPQWSRVEKCRLLRDKLDGLPLRYKPRTTKYISFKENEMDTNRRILNTIASLKPVPPGSCLARSPLTPWYWLEDTYPDMVSASLKDLATQHMKYFRASPSRAPAQQAGRSQIQIMEDLYWEEVKKMRVPETADENYSRLQLVRCFIRKIQCGSIIKGTSLISEGKDKSGDLSQVNTKTAQLNYTACLNTNNNGYTKEEGDCDLDTAGSSVFGSKSDRGFSRGQDVVRNKPRHSYLNKRHSDGYRSRNRRPTGADGAYVDCDKTCVEPEKRKTHTAEDPAQLTDSTLQQCHSRDAKLPQGKEDKILSPIKRDPERGQMSSATYRAPTSGHHGNHLNKEVVPPLDLQDDSKHLKELFKDVSQYNSLCDVPDSVKERVVLLICTPFLEGGYSSGLCFLSDLIESSEESSPGRPWQNLEQCLDQCGSTEGTAQSHISPSMESEEYSTIQMERDLWYREAHYRRHGKFPVFEDNPTNEDDFMGDLRFTNNSPDERAEPSHSFLHDDFSHEDDVLDIPTLSILSPSRASLGQAYRGGHPFSCMSTLDHDQDKLASNEPFPSEYVFKRACGPSFSMSSEFWHIKIPTLPSNMVDYKVEQDGLTEIVIGSGSFGEVYAATLTVSPGLSRDVVVKEHFTDKTTLESVANEAKITMYLESTGCVPICYGLLMNEEDCYSIVMEYVGSGQTLYDIMCESGVPRLHWLNIVCQLASGLKKIHNKDVLINDIKSDNILVDMSGALPTVKFCDMGTASYKSGVTYKGAMEECVHLAPEACAHVETTPACDVYSFGRVLKKIHGVSHISALLSLSDTCMAEDPADRPTLSTLSQRLQDEYTKEVLFPTLTLTVPSLSLDFSDEETEDESAGSVGINTPINIDTSSPSSAEVNDAVSSDIRSSRGSNRSIRSGEVSTSNNKDPATMLIVEESGTSLGFVNSAEVQDSSFISKIHMSCSLDPVSSYGHATCNMNMHTCIEFSAEIKDTPVVTSKSAQDGSPSLPNYADAATYKAAQVGSPSLTNYMLTNAATSKSAQDGSPSLTNYADAATSKSAQDGSPSLTNYADVATSKSAQDGSPSLTNYADAATSKSAQDGSPSLTNYADAASSKSAQDGSPSLTNYADAATSKSAQDRSPSLTNYADAASSKSAQDGSPSLTNYADAATSKSAQDGSPSLTNYADAATSKSAQDGSPSLTNYADAATSKSAQDGSPSLTNYADAATSKSAQDGSSSLDASSTGETLEIPSAFHSPNGSPGRYTPTANSLYISTPTTASCATSHFHTPSASPELFSAAGSPRFLSATETPKNASCERHRLDASSDVFVDAAEDHPAALYEVDGVHVIAAVDGSPSPSDLDAPHTAAYRALCQKELDVYNKHCEDTPMYEDYLPLVLPLLLLPLRILGFI